MRKLGFTTIAALAFCGNYGDVRMKCKQKRTDAILNITGVRASRHCCFFLVIAMLVVVCGCARQEDVAAAEETQASLSSEMGISISKSDALYIAHRESRDPLVRQFLFKNVREEFKDSSWFKRQHALAMARGFLTYQFRTYIYYDGVSGLIYNVAYIFSIPCKMLSCLLSSDGVIGYVGDFFKICLGGVFAIIGVFVATAINTLCHPIETLANLTIGLFYFGPGWWSYVTHTNIVASLWDLIAGGMIYPIWQALVFWL